MEEGDKEVHVSLVLRLQGGGLSRGIKKHATKQEATSALKVRVVQHVAGNDDFTSLTFHADGIGLVSIMIPSQR